jgi:hypothetical protein
MERRLEKLLYALGVDVGRFNEVIGHIYAADVGTSIDEQPLFTRDLRYSNNKELNVTLSPCDHVKQGALEAFHICLLGLTLSMRKQNPMIFDGVDLEELAVVCLLCDTGKTGCYYPASNYGKERGIFWEYDTNVPAPQAELTVALAYRYGIKLTNNEFIGLRLAATPLSEDSSKSFGRHIKPWLLMVSGLAQVIRHNQFDLETYSNKVLAALKIDGEPIKLRNP